MNRGILARIRQYVKIVSEVLPVLATQAIQVTSAWISMNVYLVELIAIETPNVQIQSVASSVSVTKTTMEIVKSVIEVNVTTSCVRQTKLAFLLQL